MSAHPGSPHCTYRRTAARWLFVVALVLISSLGVGASSAFAEGACCIGDDCLILTELQCTERRGEWHGEGTTCDPSPCVTAETGACCLGDDCVELTEE